MALALFFGFAIKLTFGIIGCLAMNQTSNLFDNLLFSEDVTFEVNVIMVVFSMFIVLPQVINSSLEVNYFLYIGGLCDVPCNYFWGIVLPWIIGMLFNHLEIFSYLINWTSLSSVFYVSIICPMFIWCKTLKEA